MSETQLDQIVKGAPSPSTKPPPNAPPPPLQNISAASTVTTESSSPNNNPNPNNTTTNPSIPSIPSLQIPDPLSHLPSSPPQIYLNLLILESSLRAQYLQLLSRRHLHTFFVLLLSLYTFTFTYLLFLRPREDGLGLGGSVYWVVETMEKVALMGGAVTAILFWGTGQWERGIRWPRRWVGTTNRGLRGFNLRVVVPRGPWWRDWPRHLAFLVPMWNLQSSGSEWHLVEYSSRQHGGRHQHPHHHHHHHRHRIHPGREADDDDGDDEEVEVDVEEEEAEGTAGISMIGGLVEEDLAPGGDYIKLLLLPKSFSPEFRENWEEYRTDYWERENDRRAVLRAKVKQQRRARAKHEGGWMWWSGLWRTRRPLPSRRDLEKHGLAHRPQLGGGGVEKALAAARRRSFLRTDSTNHSRASSSASTPATEGAEERPVSERIRRGSSAASTRRKAKERGTMSLGRVNTMSPLTKSDDSRTGSRTTTPGTEISAFLGRGHGGI